VATMAKSIELDDINVRILRALQQDARISLSQLAEQAGLSASPCSVRLRRLEKLGYITGYVARVDERRFGEFITVFAEVTLIDQQDKTYKAFEKRVASIPEILECHSVSGDTDYILKICIDGMHNYQRLTEMLLEEMGYVRSFKSSVSMSTIKSNFQPAIEQLEKAISKQA